ncbi:hypothetical protein JCM1840_000327 [Sporobolomyces johnsonii]
MSDSTRAPASAPAVLKLPDELLLSILTRPELGYRDVKRFSRVCKRTHALEQDRSLDSKLFRQGPIQRQVKAGDEIAFHPVLEEIDDAMERLSPKPKCVKKAIMVSGPMGWSGYETEEYKGLGGEEGEDGGWVNEEDDLSTTPWDNEYATSPASLGLELTLDDEAALMSAHSTVSNPLGVTVRDVIVAVAKVWTSADGREALGNDGYWYGVERAVVVGNGYAELVFPCMIFD